MNRLFTSESVTEGHPDKVCDQISDSILDAYLAQDSNARVACECIVTENYLLIMGEITSTAEVDVTRIARETIRSIGYTDAELGFSADTVEIKVLLGHQSPDISQGVSCAMEHQGGGDEYDLIGAGDQGMMFGYACDETEELMPMPIMLSHKMMRRLAEVRKSGLLPYLRPDGKGQITVEYADDKPVAIDAIVLSAQHSATVPMEQLREELKKEVIDKVIPAELLTPSTKVYINPTGRFVIGGPKGDSGLTGRKIIVDTYGGYCTHGGGCFSGKDPTKVDRSAAYMARYAAKNVVAAGLARRCQIDLAYAIGVARPVAVYVNTFGTATVSDSVLLEAVKQVFDFRPRAIIVTLGLNKPQFKNVACYGHFGGNAVWEKTDKADALKKAVRSLCS